MGTAALAAGSERTPDSLREEDPANDFELEET